MKSYISSLHSEIKKLGGRDNVDMGDNNNGTGDADRDADMKADDDDDDDADAVPQYESGEDYERASEMKAKATECKEGGQLDEALDYYNQAVLAAPPSALLYANRAVVLEKLGRYKAAEHDCKLALEQNPDSAKALKVRGTLRYQHLDDWHGALSDLSQAQALDFDPELAETLKELTKKRVEEELKEAQDRIDKQDSLKKRAEEIKKAQEEAMRDDDEEAYSSSRGAGGGMPGGMPGGGMPGGPGMAGMAEMMKDPEIMEAMQNPKVVAAFSELMNSPGGPMGLLSNPQKLQDMMADPEVGPVLQKLMGKFMGAGGMGGMPNMGGGMGGMPPSSNDDADGIPDMEDLPDLD